MPRHKSLLAALAAVLTLAFVAELALVQYAATRVHVFIQSGEAVTLARAGSIVARDLTATGRRQLAAIPARAVSKAVRGAASITRVAEAFGGNSPASDSSELLLGEPDVIIQATCPQVKSGSPGVACTRSVKWRVIRRSTT
jgi:hypothetical protein